MAAISVRRLTEQLNDFMCHTSDISKDAMICGAHVCNAQDPDYPEGTLLLRCMNENTNAMEFTDHIKWLIIYPEQISKVN